MVGEIRELVLKDILSEKQIQHILKQSIGEDVSWVYKNCEVRPAVDGIAGFLGDHLKAVLKLDVDEELKEVYLFLKRIPESNKAKAEFITGNNFFKHEKFMYQMIEELNEHDVNPWSVKPYIYTDTMIVLPDLTHQNYKHQCVQKPLDLQHVLIATNSIARFHAAIVNYETKKSIELNRPYSTLEEVGDLLDERAFCDSPWLKTCSKLSANLLKKFSTKLYKNVPDLESKLRKLYLEACDSLTEYKNTVNSLLHKDLWVNNIMFKYDNNTPINAILIDYQCLRYGPPAFDVMIFLYLSTDQRFRAEYEKNVIDYYFTMFTKNLNEKSKERVNNLGYDKGEFLKWCEKARMFSILVAIGIFPYIFMDPKTAQATFDDPETFKKYLQEDRSDPVIAYCLKSDLYKQRNLEVVEEFADRYLLKEL